MTTPQGLVERVARELVAKLDQCAPHIADAFLHRQLRCGDYTGPTYSAELKALREALDDQLAPRTSSR